MQGAKVRNDGMIFYQYSIKKLLPEMMLIKVPLRGIILI